MDMEKVKEYFEFQTHRRITALYKSFLCLLEDLEREGTISKADFERERGRVLSIGNNAARDSKEDIEKLFSIL
jgi:hypothetical protein